jgi:hypothetical protein
MMYPGYEVEAAQAESWSFSTEDTGAGTTSQTSVPMGCARIQCAVSESESQVRLVTWLAGLLSHRKSHSGI